VTLSDASAAAGVSGRQATGCSFIATDINPAALAATAATLDAHGVRLHVNVQLVALMEA
jgi:methylase of polypeptide subunit release factors